MINKPAAIGRRPREEIEILREKSHRREESHNPRERESNIIEKTGFLFAWRYRTHYFERLLLPSINLHVTPHTVKMCLPCGEIMLFNSQKGLCKGKDTNRLKNIRLPDPIGSDEEMEITPCKIEKEMGICTELLEMERKNFHFVCSTASRKSF